MQKREATLSAFQFRRAKADLIQVFNEGSYLMAEYNERTGTVSWHRVLLGTQREIIEKWLRDRYPVPAVQPTWKPVHAEAAPRRGNRAQPRHQKRVAR
jgi:hypothetical protein